MNHDFELKLQAWLDGEMPADEAARFSQAVASDPEASALLAELSAVKTALHGNELPIQVPATREFYWSQIQREITRQEARETPAVHANFLTQMRRFLVPLTGTAAVVSLLIFSVRHSIPAPAFTEITMTSSAMETMTFHDHATKMTVVWLSPKHTDNTVTESPVFDEWGDTFDNP
jgi:anti-sigma factor RsiW